MTDEDDEVKQPLSRERILNANNGPKVYQLPSGKTVHTAFLSWGMVQEIEKSSESAAEEGKEHLFALKVVEWMLRKNDQKDYRSFSSEDQRRLIEIAVEEWGCEDEYDQFSDTNDPEVRFYQAVRLQEKELAEQLYESVRAISANLASTIAPIKVIQDEMASSFQEILGQYNLANQVGEAFKDINTRMMDQIREISKLSVPIANFAGAIDAFGNSLRRSYESNILKEVGGTITSYQYLMKDVFPVERFMVLPDAIRYYPTIEMHNTSIVAGQILGGDEYEIEGEVIVPDTDELKSWLNELDPSFPIMLDGANQAIYSQNPDRCRHFASSHRELCTHIQQSLAPDSAVRGWTNDPNHFHEGRPTRKARLLFIVRNYTNKPFVEFFVKDFINQMDLLNADEHRKANDFGEKELHLLHERFLSALGFLKEIISYH